MLRQSMKALGGEDLLNSVGIKPTLRAEELSMEDFVSIAQYMEQRAG
jgi:16S rRNA (adenine1518-N6/adenine1519-N6)-dimethyltransferase